MENHLIGQLHFMNLNHLLSEKTRVILPLYERGEEIGYVGLKSQKISYIPKSMNSSKRREI
jgi:hypothetical protein